MLDQQNEPLDAVAFKFWDVPEGMSLTTGEKEELPLPHISLPIKTEDLPTTAAPSEKAIGDGIYEYLCRFPFCRHAETYAQILKEAYPFLVADIGSQLIVLDVKDVNPEGLRRKINLLKILVYLEPENFGLLHKIGRAFYDLSLYYPELSRVKYHLKEARSWLEKARRVQTADTGNLNLLGQVCYLNGSYHQARLYWRVAANSLDDGEGKTELVARLARIEADNIPEQPLCDSLEAIAAALEHIHIEEYAAARKILEQLEAVGDLPRELPNPEFYYLLGVCREKTEAAAEAFEAFSTAVALDKNHQPSRDALNRLQEKPQGE